MANNDGWHIDHKFSVLAGYRNKVPPKIIGSIVNLQMIPARENISKSSKCSISLRQLYELYYSYRHERKKNSHHKSVYRQNL